MKEKSPNRKIALSFTLDGFIIGDNEITIQRILKVLKTTFPATKIKFIQIIQKDESE
jgi:hypothetical protein